MTLILLTACVLAEETEPTVYTAGDWDYIFLQTAQRRSQDTPAPRPS